MSLKRLCEWDTLVETTGLRNAYLTLERQIQEMKLKRETQVRLSLSNPNRKKLEYV